MQMIDTSIVRVQQHGAGTTRTRRQSMKVTRRLTSKMHALVDSNDPSVWRALSPGEAHEVRLAGKLLSRLKSGSMLLADRGYDADWIRERSDPICLGPYLYRASNQVERLFNRIRYAVGWRRAATGLRKLPCLRPTRIYPPMAGRAL